MPDYADVAVQAALALRSGRLISAREAWDNVKQSCFNWINTFKLETIALMRMRRQLPDAATNIGESRRTVAAHGSATADGVLQDR